MKKRLLAVLCIGVLLAAPACSVRRKPTEKIRDLEFSVVRKEELPEEFLKEIEGRGYKEFRMTYRDQGALYIARGYGEKNTTGYTVSVSGCFETEEAVWLQTDLSGPPKEEKVKNERNNPYVAVRLNDIGKEVIFE